MNAQLYPDKNLQVLIEKAALKIEDEMRREIDLNRMNRLLTADDLLKDAWFAIEGSAR
jgi:hypothetical protein